jgi:hypothetical protein
MKERSTMRVTAAILALAMSSVCAAAVEDVQRQIQQREQSQLELRLKMQQQHDRALQQPANPAADQQQRMLQREQQQRLQQLQERQSRESIGAKPPGEMQREIDRQRASQAASEQLKRFEVERQLESERSRSGELNVRD